MLTELSYASLKVNYMTIPVYVVGAISLSVQVYWSDRLKRRGVFIVACCIPVAAGYLVCVGTPNAGAGYAGMFILVLGQSYNIAYGSHANLTRVVPNLNIGCHLDSDEPVARLQARFWHALCVFHCKHIQLGVFAAVS